MQNETQQQNNLDNPRIIKVDTRTDKTFKSRFIGGIGYAAGSAVPANFTELEAVTHYRFMPSSDARYTEDAANIAQAEAWLNVGNADIPDSDADQNHSVVLAHTWSDWLDFPDDTFLPNIYLSLDMLSAGTADTNTVNKLVDSTADFNAQEIEIGYTAHNITDSTRALITGITNSTSLDFASDLFPDGDEDYVITKGSRLTARARVEAI